VTPRPKLTPATVADDQLLAHVVDEVIHTDPDAASLQAEILRLQHDLRELVDANAWAAYLSVEEQVTARWSELTLVLVRWAYEQGVKFNGGRSA
jgi:hypothetical protein